MRSAAHLGVRDQTSGMSTEPETLQPNPYLLGNFAPVAEEVTAFDLPVLVDLDRAFAGRFPFRWNDDYGSGAPTGGDLGLLMGVRATRAKEIQ